MAGIRLHSQPRDYADLGRTHEQVAAKQNATPRGSGDDIGKPLSAEQLQTMAERYTELRKTSKLEPTVADKREHERLGQLQAADRERLDREHGPSPTVEQKQQRQLLDRQHLAEQVGTEARSIAQGLRRSGAGGAESFEQESRRAHQTARSLHAERQNLRGNPDRGQEAERVTQQQEQQKQKDAQEATLGSKPLTSEQRASAAPEVKLALDRKERDAATKKTGAEHDFRGAQKEVAKPGNTRPGGRGR